MRSFLNAYFSYRKDPALAIRNLVVERHFGAAFLGYGVAALCWVCFFWTGSALSAPGFFWRFLFFWLLEISVGYVWAALSGLVLNFFSENNGPSALFIALGVSGFVQGLLLWFALVAAMVPSLHSGALVCLLLLVTLLLRFGFAALNMARAVQISLKKAVATLCFVLVPALVLMMLFVGTIVLLAN